jgi:hypothetical protein
MSTKSTLHDLNIEMKLTSQPLQYKSVLNTYEKGSFFCVLHMKDDVQVVDKIPLRDIHRVRERYHYQDSSPILENVRASLSDLLKAGTLTKDSYGTSMEAINEHELSK